MGSGRAGLRESTEVPGSTWKSMRVNGCKLNHIKNRGKQEERTYKVHTAFDFAVSDISDIKHLNGIKLGVQCELTPRG
jgi:hypothetical protein